MAEPIAFAMIFVIILILLGIPLLLYGLLQYRSQPEIASSILALSIFMLLLGVIFLIVILTHK
ncbi:MAG: hypothetical protein QXK49_00125 [Candidatus Aenigmatarchaeota archaeon]